MASFLLNPITSTVTQAVAIAEGGFEHACQSGIGEHGCVDKMRPRGLQVHGQTGPAVLQRLLRQHGQGEQAHEGEVRVRPSPMRNATLNQDRMQP